MAAARADTGEARHFGYDVIESGAAADLPCS
jgi:hypothetical protein